jgi:DNA polymerase III epsilon subunit-like protein
VNKLFVDCETTGFRSFSHDVIEIGAVLTDDDCNVLSEFQTLVQPWNKTDYKDEAIQKAMSISKITPKMLRNAPDSYKASKMFMRWLWDNSQSDMELIGHNGKFFDHNFIENWMRKTELLYYFYKRVQPYHWKDTVKIGREQGIKDNKLSTWIKRLDLKTNHHRGLDDAYACLEVYKSLRNSQFSLN